MLFLGLASNYSIRATLRHAFYLGTKKDYQKLEKKLATRYETTEEKVSLVYSGRTAICLALKSFMASSQVEKGDHVVINGFTCHAVIEAVKKAGLVPIFADIEPETPDFSPNTLEKILKSDKKAKVVILQNSFGYPCDIKAFEKLKSKYNFLILEDLAHCAGRKYHDNREIGSVGDAACLSFGKGKAIDTIIGGAIILRNNFSFPKSFKKIELKKPKLADSLRAGWYPIFGSIARGLSHIHLEKPFLALLLKLHWIERSADTNLDETRTITDWQAKLALKQLKELPNRPLRKYTLVNNREQCLKELKEKGFRLEELWYEVPVAPSRYYKSVHFPEKDCPNAVVFAQKVVNLPTWYKDQKHKRELKEAERIIKKYQQR